MQRAASKTPQPDPRERALAHTLGLPDLVVRVLLARGFDDPERVRTFLRPDLRSLHDPFLFRDMRKAVDRIQVALRGREPILIHGDYDVDGISGAVLLHKFFSLLHGTSSPYIPAREHGYSFSRTSVEAIKSGGFKLVISVDNGTNAVEPIAELQRCGIDVIVTDHHGTSENVAEPFALLNPRLPGAGYPDRNLAGWIRDRGGKPTMWNTGHALVKAKLKETGAPLAGEMSGHVFFKERWFGFDDGLYTGARLLEILSRRPDPNTALKALPNAVCTPELNLKMAEGEPFELVGRLKEAAPFPGAESVLTIDGVRVEYADGFGLARPSNTTPVVVLRFEADTPEAIARIQDDFRRAIEGVWPGAKLPF